MHLWCDKTTRVKRCWKILILSLQACGFHTTESETKCNFDNLARDSKSIVDLSNTNVYQVLAKYASKTYIVSSTPARAITSDSRISLTKARSDC